jgi:aspartyl-tRNA(Asn)/glutamyl-tRNA(Gln) amidotransferase subunit A
MIDFNALAAANMPLNAFNCFDLMAEYGDGPLTGLNVGVKANIAVKGLPWTIGCEAYRHRVSQRDAEVVAKLRTAGAAIIGMLNMDEAALGAQTNNPWFGATQNPHALGQHRIGHTPGGSSGGSGAAVAAGLCDVALGSDTMGSVRIPASYCGIYGFKPANTSISDDGLEPSEPTLDVIGPMARSLDMLERVARIISDFGEGDNNGPDTVAAGMVLADLGGVECTADVFSVYNNTASRLGVLQKVTLGTPLSRIRFAGFIKTSRSMAVAFAGVDQALLSPQLQKLLSYGPKRSDLDWAEDQRILDLTAQEVKALVARNGFLLMPTAPQAAFPHSEAAPANQADFTCLANIAGLPAISFPAGWSSEGLPIGVQLVGQTGHEAGLFDLAKALDKGLAAYRPPASFGY